MTHPGISDLHFCVVLCFHIGIQPLVEIQSHMSGPRHSSSAPSHCHLTHFPWFRRNTLLHHVCTSGPHCSSLVLVIIIAKCTETQLHSCCDTDRVMLLDGPASPLLYEDGRPVLRSCFAGGEGGSVFSSQHVESGSQYLRVTGHPLREDLPMKCGSPGLHSCLCVPPPTSSTSHEVALLLSPSKRCWVDDGVGPQLPELISGLQISLTLEQGPG